MYQPHTGGLHIAFNFSTLFLQTMSGHPCDINAELEAQRSSNLGKFEAEIQPQVFAPPKLTVFPSTKGACSGEGGRDLTRQINDSAVGFTLPTRP